MDKGIIFIPLVGRSAAFCGLLDSPFVLFIKNNAFENQPARLSAEK